jgi:hypothetical protein
MKRTCRSNHASAAMANPSTMLTSRPKTSAEAPVTFRAASRGFWRRFSQTVNCVCSSVLFYRHARVFPHWCREWISWVVARRAGQAGSERLPRVLRRRFAKPTCPLFALADFTVFSVIQIALRRFAPSLRSSRLIRDQLFAHPYMSTPDVARSPPN